MRGCAARARGVLPMVTVMIVVGPAGVLAACGGSPAAVTPSASRADAASDAGAADSGPVELLPSLDVLAARGPNEAPLMRELLRVERAVPRSAEVRADRDLCLRAVFAASGPARAWFAEPSGAVRGDVTAASGAAGAAGVAGVPGVAGTVPPRGPACVKKGESLHLVVASGDPRDAGSDAGRDVRDTRFEARAVIFAAP